MPTMTVLVDGTVPVAADFMNNFNLLNAAIGTGTSISAFVTGDILYASATNTLSRLAKGSDGQTLQLTSGLPAWGSSNVPVGYRNYRMTFASANAVTIQRQVLRSSVLGMDAEVMGLLLSRTTDKTLSMADGSGDIRGGYTAGTGTISTTSGSAAVTFSSSQAFNIGDTVVTAGSAKYAILSGATTAWTLEAAATATETTVAFTRSTTSTGHTLSGSRCPGCLYFVYAWSNTGLDFYLDTTMPVTGYHPVNTGDRWAGIQIWNNPSNALDQTWSVVPGRTMVPQLVGTMAGNYTTSSGTFSDVDATNLKRLLYVPAGGRISAAISCGSTSGTGASDQGQIVLAQNTLTAIGISVKPPQTASSGFSTFNVGTRGLAVTADTLAAYGLSFKADTGTLTIINGTTDVRIQRPDMTLTVEE